MQERFNYLLDRYRSLQATPAELQEFYKMLSNGAYDEQFIEIIDHTFELDDDNDARGNDDQYYPSGAGKRMLKHTLGFSDDQAPYKSKSKIRKLWSGITIAAASIALILFGFWFFAGSYNNGSLSSLSSYASEIAPGSSGATLTLSNGKKIILTDAVNGRLASEGAVTISKSADGQLSYVISDQNQDDPTSQNDNAVNTLSTARGQTIQVLLPDGSIVILNAASSITYSSSLINQGKREVTLHGEGYFEIAKDTTHPFVVKTAHQEVQVLGTKFNINSYENEAVEKTTLLEGSVKMLAAGKREVLEPGQQAVLKGNSLIVAQIETDIAVAWKNNEFMFKSESIEGLMRMVERWYNVEVIYIGDKTTEKFSGSVSRFDHISNLLTVIESTGSVHFKIEDRKIYVSKI